MKILINGSTGLIGSCLIDALNEEGYTVCRLVRNKAIAKRANCVDILWDPINKSIDNEGLDSIGPIDYGINLAGFPIGSKRWNSKIKAAILESRISATEFFVDILQKYSPMPTGLLSASAIGIYGDTKDHIVTETSRLGTDFLAEVCLKWEQAAANFGDNVTYLRTGIVLSKKGGALKKQLGIFKLGLGGQLSDGSQWLSWISLDDEVRAIVHCIKNNIFGPVNLTSPSPITNLEFTKILGKVLRRPTIFKVPKAGLRVALGSEMAEQLLLVSQQISPEHLLNSRFKFKDINLKDFLEEQLRSVRQLN